MLSIKTQKSPQALLILILSLIFLFLIKSIIVESVIPELKDNHVELNELLGNVLKKVG
jgi:hypothetical protein